MNESIASLRAALEQALSADAEEDARMLSRRVRLDTWRAVGLGERDRPAAWIEALAALGRRVRAAQAGAGAVIAGLLDELSLAHAAMPGEVPVAAIEASRSDTERSVLASVAEALGWSSRSEVHEALHAGTRPTRQRVGQVLAALADEGLLSRRFERRQGAARAACYRLSPAGQRWWKAQGRPVLRVAGFPAREEPIDLAAVRRQLEAADGEVRDDTQGDVVVLLSPGEAVLPQVRIGELARRYAALAGDVWLVDLDLDRPALDAHMACDALGTAGGVAALLRDYHAVADRREAWLVEALRGDRYAVSPTPALPGLRYLPTGLGPRGPRDLGRDAVWAWLDEAWRAFAHGEGFLVDLGEALRATGANSLVNAGVGLGRAGFVATVGLADRLATAVSDRLDDLAQVAIVLREAARHGRLPGRLEDRFLPILVHRGGDPTGLDAFRRLFRARADRFTWPAVIDAHRGTHAVRYPRFAEIPGSRAFIDEAGGWLPGRATVSDLVFSYDLLCWEILRGSGPGRRLGARAAGPIGRLVARVADPTALDRDRERAATVLRTLDRPTTVHGFREALPRAWDTDALGRSLLASATVSILAKQVAITVDGASTFEGQHGAVAK